MNATIKKLSDKEKNENKAIDTPILDQICKFFEAITSHADFITDSGWNLTYLRTLDLSCNLEGIFIFKFQVGDLIFSQLKDELIKINRGDYIKNNIVTMILADEYHIEIVNEWT